MRRIASLLLILLSGFGPLAGLLRSSDDVRLPACCRRLGAHHCAMATDMAAMMVSDAAGKTPSLTVPLTCPMYPGQHGAPSAPTGVPVTAASLPTFAEHAAVAPVSQSEPLMRSMGARVARGPPDISSENV